MSKALESQRQQRLQWLAGLTGEPVENVTLSPLAEPVEPDFHRCGGGQGSECCIFLTCSSLGFECERYGTAHEYLLLQKPRMRAQRVPDEAYPACMKFPAKDENDGET